MTQYSNEDFVWITPRTYADQYKAARMKLGLKKKALAKRIGACTKQITKWESGKCYPRPIMYARLKDALHMD
jgi:ribosome-binding protein aMBF1 (putative translation factor)